MLITRTFVLQLALEAPSRHYPLTQPRQLQRNEQHRHKESGHGHNSAWPNPFRERDMLLLAPLQKTDSDYIGRAAYDREISQQCPAKQQTPPKGSHVDACLLQVAKDGNEGGNRQDIVHDRAEQPAGPGYGYQKSNRSATGQTQNALGEDLGNPHITESSDGSKEEHEKCQRPPVNTPLDQLATPLPLKNHRPPRR